MKTIFTFENENELELLIILSKHGKLNTLESIEHICICGASHKTTPFDDLPDITADKNEKFLKKHFKCGVISDQN